jgi:hypothetical protein
MIWFFTPYSFEKRLFVAWDRYMNLVQDENDWACMADGDTCFLLPDFGHQIRQYIDRYPETGLFTCYASRTANKDQLLNGINSENPDLVFHRCQAEYCRENLHPGAKDIFKAYGHLMVIQKKTWLKIRWLVKKYTRNSGLLDTDTAVSRAVRKNNLKIKVMEGMYILHYYRLKDKGRGHLL